MADWVMLAAMAVGVMIFVGVGVHYGERWVDRHFDIGERK